MMGIPCDVEALYNKDFKARPLTQYIFISFHFISHILNQFLCGCQLFAMSLEIKIIRIQSHGLKQKAISKEKMTE